MKYTAFFMLFLISGEASGQEFWIPGHVRDKTLSQPLAGAVVQLFSSGGKTLHSATITDAAGDFILTAPMTGRKFELRVTFAGYSHYSQKLKRADMQTQSFHIDMEEDLRTYPPRLNNAAQTSPKGSVQSHTRVDGDDQQVLRPVVKYTTKAPKEQAAAIAKTMKTKLDLNASQQVVVAIIQEKYLASLSSIAASGSESKISVQELRKHQKERNQKLEGVLTEQQYEKWMRYLEKHSEG